MILEERLDLSSLNANATLNAGEEKSVRTLSGKDISTGLVVYFSRRLSHVRRCSCDLQLLCTGQRPNTGILAQAIPEAVIADGSKKGLVRIARTMQIAAPFKGADGSADGFQVVNPNLFAIGDAADAFGAIKAGHTAFMQVRLSCLCVCHDGIKLRSCSFPG